MVLSRYMYGLTNLAFPGANDDATFEFQSGVHEHWSCARHPFVIFCVQPYLVAMAVTDRQAFPSDCLILSFTCFTHVGYRVHPAITSMRHHSTGAGEPDSAPGARSMPEQARRPDPAGAGKLGGFGKAETLGQQPERRDSAGARETEGTRATMPQARSRRRSGNSWFCRR
ncbi:unnamed protein product [Pylaiella littoralis]